MSKRGQKVVRGSAVVRIDTDALQKLRELAEATGYSCPKLLNMGIKLLMKDPIITGLYEVAELKKELEAELVMTMRPRKRS